MSLECSQDRTELWPIDWRGAKSIEEAVKMLPGREGGFVNPILSCYSFPFIDKTDAPEVPQFVRAEIDESRSLSFDALEKVFGRESLEPVYLALAGHVFHKKPGKEEWAQLKKQHTAEEIERAMIPKNEDAAAYQVYEDACDLLIPKKCLFCSQSLSEVSPEIPYFSFLVIEPLDRVYRTGTWSQSYHQNSVTKTNIFFWMCCDCLQKVPKTYNSLVADVAFPRPILTNAEFKERFDRSWAEAEERSKNPVPGSDPSTEVRHEIIIDPSALALLTKEMGGEEAAQAAIADLAESTGAKVEVRPVRQR